MHRVAASLVALMTAATFLLGARVSPHVRVEPLVNFALPPATAGCGGATALAGGAERIPITVSIGLAVSRFSLGRSVVEEAAEALFQAKNSGGCPIVPAGEMPDLRLAI